jgi:FixJ family two-component response regulator
VNSFIQISVEARAQMPELAPIVYIVDDDISMRESLESLLVSEGHQVRAFPTANEFLAHRRSAAAGCLVLDLNLPDLNGLALQERLGAGQARLPIIFITGHGNIPASVRAMKAGAVEFLTKPFDTDALLAAIDGAITRSRSRIAEDADLSILQKRFETLSRRERDVMELVVRGKLNKQIAGDLEISVITVKAHRGRVMRKMRARSLADLVTVASLLGMRTAHERVSS